MKNLLKPILEKYALSPTGTTWFISIGKST